jgi:hypothetical protein
LPGASFACLEPPELAGKLSSEGLLSLAFFLNFLPFSSFPSAFVSPVVTMFDDLDMKSATFQGLLQPPKVEGCQLGHLGKEFWPLGYAMRCVGAVQGK